MSPRFWCLTCLLGVLAAGCDWPAARPPGETCREVSRVPVTTISLDGYPDDWADIPAALERPTGVGLPAAGHALSSFFVAADSKSLCLRVDLVAANAPAREGEGPDAGSQPSCGNGSCEPAAGESVLTCPEDCHGDEHSGLSVFFKAPGYRSGSLGLYPNPNGSPGCEGHWDGVGEGNPALYFYCEAKTRAESNPRVVEISVPRSELWAPVTLFPVWARNQNNGPPLLEDEIGCVFVMSISN
jgi:hypothetical protein